MNLYNHLGLYRLILIRSYTYSGITLMVDLSLFGSTLRYYKLILVLRNLYLFYEVYHGLTGLIRFLRILFLCEGTRRYDESGQVRIISHTRSD